MRTWSACRRTLPSSTSCTFSSRAISGTSICCPLKANDDVRAATCSSGMCASTFNSCSLIPSEKYSFSGSPDIFAKGNTAIDRAPLVILACGQSHTYQPMMTVPRIPTMMKNALSFFDPDSVLMPAGVTSNTHASTSASGKPRRKMKVTKRGTQSGRFSCGARISAIWINTHATSR